MGSAVDYSNLFRPELLKARGLAVKDIEESIEFAHQLSEAVKMRRDKLRQATATLTVPTEEARLERERREQADDDRLFLGVVTLLAQRMKRTS
jgi:hypothetical protein